MSIAEIMSSLLEGGANALAVLAVLPFAVGLVAWVLDRQGQERASQLAANAGIAFGLFSIVVMVCSLLWGASHGTSGVEDVGLVWLLMPFYLTVTSFFIENFIHPERQEAIRTQIRRGFLIVIVLVVVYWLLSRMRIWMLVHTSILGLVFFVGLLVGILYFLVRKLI